jgi:hypothetical protein
VISCVVEGQIQSLLFLDVSTPPDLQWSSRNLLEGKQVEMLVGLEPHL